MSIPIIDTMRGAVVQGLFNDPGLFTFTILIMAFSIVALLIFLLIKEGLFENISLSLRSSPSGAGNSSKKKKKSKNNSGNDFKEDLDNEFKSDEVAASENSQSDDEFGIDEDFEEGGDDFSDEDFEEDLEKDEFGGGGAQNRRIDEIESRLNTVENQVEDVSSKTDNIREENESAMEQLDDMQADIRKLLEIYEVISEGINPFIGGGEETEGFDLFEQAQNPEEPKEFKEENKEESEFETEEPKNEYQKAREDEEKFKELKEQEQQQEPENLEDEFIEQEEPKEIKEKTEPDHEKNQKKPKNPPKEKTKTEKEKETKPKNPTQNHPPNQSPKSKENIYLNKLTKDFKTDLIVLEWVKHLKKHKQDNLNKLLNYYVDIGWISQNVRNNLLTYSRGITTENQNKKTKKEITIKDHIKSLKYIAKIYEDKEKEKDLKKEIKNLKTNNKENNKETK